MFNIVEYLLNQSKCEENKNINDVNKINTPDKLNIHNKFRDVDVPVEEYNLEKYKLKFAQILTRHGRRTPESQKYPFSLWTCNSIENLITNKDIENRPACENGQLTVLGVQDLINVGQAYKQLFINDLKFLDKEYNPDQVYVRSTDRERTISSARSLMHGLYGGSFNDNTELSPKHTQFVIHPQEAENMYPRTCPRMQFFKSLLKKHPEVLKEREESNLNGFTEKVKKIFEDSKGFDSPFYVPNFNSYTGLVNSFDCFKNHSLPMPKGFTPDVIDRMYKEASKEFKIQKNFREISVLGIGRFVKDLTDQLKLVAKNDKSVDKLKFAYYSGHDTTLGALLVAYDMYEDKYHPVTSSTLEFLLFEDKQPKQSTTTTTTTKTSTSSPYDNQYVKVMFNQKVTHITECKSKEVDNMCPLSEFLKISQSLIPEDWSEQCKISSEEKKRYNIAFNNI